MYYYNYYLTITAIFLALGAHSQVYNYEPFLISNIETNPSFVASDRSNLLIKTSQINNFQQNNSFNQTNIRVSKYFEGIFSGVGLTLNNTTLNDSINYKYAGLSLGYRNILFNRVYTKIGLNFKYLQNTSPLGNFTKFNFDLIDSTTQKRDIKNLNSSITFSDNDEHFYLTLGILNHHPENWNNNIENPFPFYRYIQLGNLFSFFDRTNMRELSFTYINSTQFNSLFVNVYNYFQVTRRRAIIYGINFGHNKNHLTFRPNISIFNSLKGNGGNLLKVQLMADFSHGINSNDKPYKPAYILKLSFAKK